MASTDRGSKYNVTITKGSDTVKGMICSGNGRLDPSAFRKTQQSRTSIKFFQGGTKYSDYEPPYRSIEQRDFSGGRGLDEFGLDETRFFDSYRINTWSGNGIQPTLRDEWSTGIVDHDEYWWEDTNTVSPNTGFIEIDFDEYHANKFVAEASYTATHIEIAWAGDEIRDGNLPQFYIFSHDAVNDEPDTQLLASGSVAGTDIIPGKVYRYAIGSQAITAGTTYWVAVKCTGLAEKDIRLLADKFASVNNVDSMSSTDGTTWSNVADDKYFYFRLLPDPVPCIAHFFEHKGSMYVVQSFDDFSNPKVYRNGWNGDVVSATSTVITVAGTPFTADEYINALVKITSGYGSDQRQNWRLITDNDTNTITTAAWDITPDETSEIAIIRTNVWSEVTGHGMTEKVTDVLSFNDLVYFCRGDNNDIYRMYDETWTVEKNNRGTFMQAAPDSDGEMQIWIATSGVPASIMSADPEFGADEHTPTDLDFSGSSSSSTVISVTNSDFEGTDGWSDVGTPTTTGRMTSQGSISGPWEGTYFWGIYCGDSEGISQDITVVEGVQYYISARIQQDEGNENDTLMTADDETIATVSETGKWLLVSGVYTATSDTLTLKFLQSGGGDRKFGVDALHIAPVGVEFSNTMYERITGLISYGEPERLWVGTEQGVYMEDQGDFLPIPLREFKYGRDERNGRAMLVHDVFLYISFHDGLERYYESNLDDMGPNQDLGMPSDRRGSIVSMAGYPGRIYVAYDGGDDNFSSILLYNQVGWHEVYRTPKTGVRISKLYIQPVSDEYIDRLWFAQDDDVGWIGIDFSAKNNSNARYFPLGYVEMQAIFANKREVEKHFDSLKISGTNLSHNQQGLTASGAWTVGQRYVEVDYYTFTTDYIALAKRTTGTIYIGAYMFGANDSRDVNDTEYMIAPRIAIYSDKPSELPEVHAVTIDLVEHVPVKWSYSFNLLLGDNKPASANYEKGARIETDISNLEAWADSAAPVTLNTPFSWADSKTVKLVTSEPRPLMVSQRGQIEQAIVTITMVEI